MTPEQALDLAHERPSSCDDDLYDWAVDAENALRLMAERLMVAEELAAQYAAEVEALRASAKPILARARDEWHLDDGPVLWWAWNGHGWADEPAWIGMPLDDDWPGYHTHWSEHPGKPAIDAARKDQP